MGIAGAVVLVCTTVFMFRSGEDLEQAATDFFAKRHAGVEADFVDGHVTRITLVRTQNPRRVLELASHLRHLRYLMIMDVGANS